MAAGESASRAGSVVTVPSLSQFVELERFGWEEELRNRLSLIAERTASELVVNVGEAHVRDGAVSGELSRTS